jgi:hypothetical protein
MLQKRSAALRIDGATSWDNIVEDDTTDIATMNTILTLQYKVKFN